MNLLAGWCFCSGRVGTLRPLGNPQNEEKRLRAILRMTLVNFPIL
jgi:hypothetical protein